MSPRVSLSIAILALVAGCATQPAGPAAPPAAARPEIQIPAQDVPGEGSEEGTMAFYVGDLGWTTATASTYQWPDPTYETGNATSSVSGS